MDAVMNGIKRDNGIKAMRIKLLVALANCKTHDEFCALGDKNALKITEIRKKYKIHSSVSFEYESGEDKPFILIIRNKCLREQNK